MSSIALGTVVCVMVRIDCSRSSASPSKFAKYSSIVTMLGFSSVLGAVIVFAPSSALFDHYPFALTHHQQFASFHLGCSRHR